MARSVACSLLYSLAAMSGATDLLAAEAAPAWLAYHEQVYGCAWNGDGLANLPIGGTIGRQICYRFRAEHSADCRQARIYLIFRALGYYRGDGGQVQVELRTDDNTNDHFPTEKILSTVLIKDPMNRDPEEPIRRGVGRLLTFDKAVRLEAGRFYHVVFSNPAPDPVNNYVSINDLYQRARTPGMQPAVTDTDWAVLRKSASDRPWQVNYGHTPIADLYYTDGFVQGQGYTNARSESFLQSLQGANQIRERFTVTERDRTVTSVLLRLRKVGTPEDLAIRLENGDSSLVEQGAIRSASVGTSATWVKLVFSKPRVLRTGKTYQVVVSAPAGDRYETWPLVRGSGYQTPTLFTDGQAEYTTGSGWQRTGNRENWQLYFTLARADPAPPDAQKQPAVFKELSVNRWPISCIASLLFQFFSSPRHH